MSFGFELLESKKVSGVYAVTPSIATDERGDIWSSFLKDDLEVLLPSGLAFKHDKFPQSHRNVLRGIHGDSKSWKLVTCVFGEITQVVVDLRKGSPTYLNWQSYKINKAQQKMVLISPGCGNAYYVSSEQAVYHYKLAYDGDYIDAAEQFSVRWDDPSIAIDWPDKVYNPAAQSHVAVSFEAPEYTTDVDGLGALRILEAIRFLGLEKKTRFYQASTSELFGLVQETPQRETTPLYPRSPYVVAKMYAYWITVNYRESYGMYACNGILFNHESMRRGETFVTRKITRGLANIALGMDPCLHLGNMDALRDWGHAKDYVRMQWMMLQQEQADDFVIATDKQISVREFVCMSAQELGVELAFSGKGIDEVAIVASIIGDNAPALTVGDVIVWVNPRYFRPVEVETLLGDSSKAKELLGWVPEITVEEMCAEMVAHDLDEARQKALLKEHGFKVPVAREN